MFIPQDLHQLTFLNSMNKKVLVIAFYYPPSSAAAVQRALKATEYLSQLGWQPVVLTARASAYDKLEPSQAIPPEVVPHTYRARAYDVQNHLAYKGKHFSWMAAIDRWTTWIPDAILLGRKLIKQYQPDLILSTTPIPSANVIANHLSQKFGIPWVADYQDPFGYHHVAINKYRAKILKTIDRNTIEHCQAAIFATTRTMEVYQRAFESVEKSRFHTITNGFDENNWKQIAQYTPDSPSPFCANKFSLYYSGVLYAYGRDPRPVFKSIGELRTQGIIDSGNFELVFQGSGDGQKFQQDLKAENIADLVTFKASVSFLDSLYFMQQANALLLIQDAIFNLQVPGKLYEYIRTGRPILTVTPTNSATASEANKYANSAVAENTNAISNSLKSWLESEPETISRKSLQCFSRYQKTVELAEIFNQVVTNTATLTKPATE